MRSLSSTLLVALVAAGFAAGAAADDNKYRNMECTAVRGMLVPECNATICNQGRVTGDLKGRFASRITSIYPSGSGWLLTSWTRIDLEGNKGRIETIDEGTSARDAQGGPDESQVMEVLTLAVLSQLHTRGNFHRIVREWFYDDEPATFWGYVVQALSGAGVPTAGLPALVPGESPASWFVPQLAARIAALPRPMVLVVDNADHLTDRSITAGLDLLIRHAGSRLRRSPSNIATYSSTICSCAPAL